MHGVSATEALKANPYPLVVSGVPGMTDSGHYNGQTQAKGKLKASVPGEEHSRTAIGIAGFTITANRLRKRMAIYTKT